MSAAETKPNGGPAFPCEGGQNNGYEPASGMSLRDWFAGQALAGLALAITLDPRGAQTVGNLAERKSIRPTEAMALICFDYADAMIAARGETA